MPSYENPHGAPLVMFQGPVQYTQDEVASACRRWGPALWLPAGCGINGPQLLWALAGVESSFGANCKPRHEMGYCRGRYGTTPAVVALTARYGHAAHASFGPWQIMLANLGEHADLSRFDTAADAARAAVGHINVEILQRQKAHRLEQIADAYNSGNYRDSNVPTAYIDAVVRSYGMPMPPVKTVPA